MTGPGFPVRTCADRPSSGGSAEHKERVADKPDLHLDDTCLAPLVRDDDSAAVQRWLARANRQRDTSSYEESGHWVGGWLAGLDLTGTTVDIVPDGFAWGSVTFDDPTMMEEVGPPPSLLGGFDTDPHDRFRLEATIVMLFTGQLAAEGAEEGHASPAPPGHPHNSFESRQEWLDSRTVERIAAAAGVPTGFSDNEQVERLLAESCASPSEAWSYGSWLFARAETMVRSRPFWLPCHAIAQQLLRLRTLTGDECVLLAEEALAPKPLPDTARTWPRRGSVGASLDRAARRRALAPAPAPQVKGEEERGHGERAAAPRPPERPSIPTTPEAA